jgi:hypothetical protein
MAQAKPEAKSPKNNRLQSPKPKQRQGAAEASIKLTTPPHTPPGLDQLTSDQLTSHQTPAPVHMHIITHHAHHTNTPLSTTHHHSSPCALARGARQLAAS